MGQESSHHDLRASNRVNHDSVSPSLLQCAAQPNNGCKVLVAQSRARLAYCQGKGRESNGNSLYSVTSSLTPRQFSVDDFERVKTSPWEGVRNYEARNLMKEMQVGEKVNKTIHSIKISSHLEIVGCVLPF